ncbi:MAG: BLUF domain-containing protein [Pseudomonadota bacterium]
MEHVTIPEQDGPRIFRLAYASRAKTEMARPAAVALAADAAERNRKHDVSGVLYSGNGIFLQWLEGPADDVCELMSRISADSRHNDLTVLSAGWMPTRRFPRWPMQLAVQLFEPGTVPSTTSTPCDADRAMLAFDHVAESYRQQTCKDDAFDIAGFAENLVRCGPGQLPDLPSSVQMNLRVRAKLVDEVCTAFARGWQDDVWTSAEIAFGLAQLTRLWQRAGRTPASRGARSCVAVVVPPGSHEVLGAIVKRDLLEAAEVAVQMVMEPNAERTFAALAQLAPTSIIIAGPRVGLAGDAARAASFAERVQARFPDLAMHLGGLASGSLCDWPDDVAWRRDATGELPAAKVEWLAMAALAAISAGPKPPSATHGRLLN